MPTLAETQREFFGALQQPLRGASRRSTELPPSDEAHHPGFLATADDLLRPSPTLSAAECLELYHRQVWFRLLDSLAEDFPGLKELLGEDAFWRLLEKYLMSHPSKSFTLRHLGRGMPDFISGEIKDRVLNRRARAVASIEYALMESFEASDLPVACSEQVARGYFSLQAHVRLLTLDADANTWLEDQQSEWIDTGPFYVAVWRDLEGSLRHRALENGEFAMLSLLPERLWLLDEWLDESAHPISDPATLSGWFSKWQGDHWFTTSPLKQ